MLQGLRRLAWPCPAPALFGRIGLSRAGFKGGTSRDSPTFDHRRDVPIELAWVQNNPSGVVAGTDVSRKTEDARCDRIGQQNGPCDLGNANEETGLSGSGAGYRSMKFMSRRTA